jgi:hypothetical protein
MLALRGTDEEGKQGKEFPAKSASLDGASPLPDQGAIMGFKF